MDYFFAFSNIKKTCGLRFRNTSPLRIGEEKRKKKEETTAAEYNGMSIAT